MKEISKIEAALYVSGRPLGIDELMKASGIRSRAKVLKLARRLVNEYRDRDGAIEVVELRGERFAMQLKRGYSRIAKLFGGKPLLTRAVLKTLSQIAFYQPISASELARVRGSHVYSHIKILKRLGLIERVGEGRGVYITTKHFSEQFGLSEDPKELKRQLSRIKDLRRG